MSLDPDARHLGEHPTDAMPTAATAPGASSMHPTRWVTEWADGELWFDPHPSRAGLVSVTEVMALRPVTHDHDPRTVLPEPVGPLIAEARRLYQEDEFGGPTDA